jgi:hypothetical protein
MRSPSIPAHDLDGRAPDLDRRIGELSALRDDLRVLAQRGRSLSRRHARPTWSATSSTRRPGSRPPDRRKHSGCQTWYDLGVVGHRHPERPRVLGDPGAGRGGWRRQETAAG